MSNVPRSARRKRSSKRTSGEDGKSTPSTPLLAPEVDGLTPVFTTGLGRLFTANCLDVLPRLPDGGGADTIFADPPFNLDKEYGPSVDDRRAEGEYGDWSRHWLTECARVLRPGGALFVYHLPRWAIILGGYLNDLGLTFRNNIAVTNKCRKRLSGRLYPARYDLLYYTKGEPNTFRVIRTPYERCRHCKRLIKDYGGHFKKMDPRGVTLGDLCTDIPPDEADEELTDTWLDVAPVRHARYKHPGYRANALSTLILDRVVETSTRPGDLVLDPFGGSGTTYSVCEKLGRRWIGIEVQSTQAIIDRLSGRVEVAHHENLDHVED
jgi:site-specific DNA-methyltransferase (adenine-specific)